MLWKRSVFLSAVILASFCGKTLVSGDEAAESATILTKDNFDEELKETNYFVKFYAPWYVP